MIPRRGSHRRRRRRLRLLRTGGIILVVVALVVLGDRVSWRHDAGVSTRTATRRRTTTLVSGSSPSPTPTVPRPTAPSTTVRSSTTVPSSTTTGRRARLGVLARTAITGYLGSRAGDVTAAVYDIDNGTASYWRPGVTEYDASISKVDILADLLHEEGSLDADDQAAAAAMIEQSDDDAANDLWEEIGEGNAEAIFNHRLGLTETKPGPGIDWGLTTTTAADQVKLLRAVVSGTPLLSAASRRVELNLMEHVEPSQAWGVSAGVAAGATIAVKNGWLPLQAADWQINSIGWVDGDGRDYIIAVLTNEDATEEYGIDTIQGLSDLVWSELAPRA